MCEGKSKGAFGLVTAEEIAAAVYLAPARLRDLADAQIVPHVRIDNGPPLFKRGDLIRHVKEHFMVQHLGRPLPLDLRVITHHPVECDVPLALTAAKKWLCEYSPALPCVYFLMREGHILYVGQSMNLSARLQQHWADGKRWDRVVYLLVPKEDALRVEAQWIQALRPPLNRTNGNRPVGHTASRQADLMLKL
jgi:hypothetical protein